jgi:hypothetical protein
MQTSHHPWVGGAVRFLSDENELAMLMGFTQSPVLKMDGLQ